MSVKKTICAFSGAAAFFIAAGVIETMPVISALLIAALAACVKIGELWEV